MGDTELAKMEMSARQELESDYRRFCRPSFSCAVSARGDKRRLKGLFSLVKNHVASTCNAFIDRAGPSTMCTFICWDGTSHRGQHRYDYMTDCVLRRSDHGYIGDLVHHVVTCIGSWSEGDRRCYFLPPMMTEGGSAETTFCAGLKAVQLPALVLPPLGTHLTCVIVVTDSCWPMLC